MLANPVGLLESTEQSALKSRRAFQSLPGQTVHGIRTQSVPNAVDNDLNETGHRFKAISGRDALASHGYDCCQLLWGHQNAFIVAFTEYRLLSGSTARTRLGTTSLVGDSH